ncbi:MAG TPA: hypothetical protein VNA24_36160 [Hyalangium sp.]|nr:hypothetical protein [Hyalangium sp.]
MKTKTVQQQAADNRANQLNSHHSAYHRSRGASPERAEELASEAGHDRTPTPESGPAPQQPGKPSPK